MTSAPDLVALISAPEARKRHDTAEAMFADHRARFPVNAHLTAEHAVDVPRHDEMSDRTRLRRVYNDISDAGIIVDGWTRSLTNVDADLTIGGSFDQKGEFRDSSSGPLVTPHGLSDAQLSFVQSILWKWGFPSIVTLGRRLRCAPRWQIGWASSQGSAPLHGLPHEDRQVQALELGMNQGSIAGVVEDEFARCCAYWMAEPEFAADQETSLQSWAHYNVLPERAAAFWRAGFDSPSTVAGAIKDGQSIRTASRWRTLAVSGFERTTWSKAGFDLDRIELWLRVLSRDQRQTAVEASTVISDADLRTIIDMCETAGITDLRVDGTVQTSRVKRQLFDVLHDARKADPDAPTRMIGEWLIGLHQLDALGMQPDGWIAQGISFSDARPWVIAAKEVHLRLPETLTWRNSEFSVDQFRAWNVHQVYSSKTVQVARNWIAAGYDCASATPWIQAGAARETRNAFGWSFDKDVKASKNLHLAEVTVAWQSCVPNRTFTPDEVLSMLNIGLTPMRMSAAAFMVTADRS